MANLPSLVSGAVARYPVTQRTCALTEVVQMVNFSEQRWRKRAKFQEFDLVYTNVNSYDMGVMKDFFISAKGAFVPATLTAPNTFTVPAPLGAPTNFCVFAQDDFTETETKSNRYTFTLRIKQVRHN